MAKKAVSTETYDDLLDRSWDEIQEPKTLPGGPWLLEARSAGYKPATETSNAKVLMFFIPKQPLPEVDADALEALGADYDVSENQVVHTFWVEFDRDWAPVKRLLTMMGVQTEGKSQKESLKSIKGAEVIGILDERSFTDASGALRTENVIKLFAPVD